MTFNFLFLHRPNFAAVLVVLDVTVVWTCSSSGRNKVYMLEATLKSEAAVHQQKQEQQPWPHGSSSCVRSRSMSCVASPTFRRDYTSDEFLLQVVPLVQSQIFCLFYCVVCIIVMLHHSGGSESNLQFAYLDKRFKRSFNNNIFLLL